MRAEGSDAAATAERSLHLLWKLLAEAGIKATPVTSLERDWIVTLQARAASPLILQFLPGRPNSVAPLASLPTDFALITVADSLLPTTIQAKAASLLEAQHRYESQLTQPEFHAQALALVESTAMRKGHYERWSGSAAVGMWRTFAYLLVGGDGEARQAGADALRKVYFDHEHLSPVSVDPLQKRTEPPARLGLGQSGPTINGFATSPSNFAAGEDSFLTQVDGAARNPS